MIPQGRLRSAEPEHLEVIWNGQIYREQVVAQQTPPPSTPIQRQAAAVRTIVRELLARHHDGLTIREICEQLHLNIATANTVIFELKRIGHVERSARALPVRRTRTIGRPAWRYRLTLP